MAETASDPITAAIISASEGAGLDLSDNSGGSDADTTTTVETPSGETPAAAATAVASPSATSTTDPPAPAAAAPVAETAEAKAEREELEALGLHEPKEGERENRLPHKRVKAMVLKAAARAKEAFAPQLAAKDSEITRLKAVETTHQRVNSFAEREPQRFLESLAVAMPDVWKPILAKLNGTAPAAAAPPVAATSEMPKPNFKNPDGTMTYDDAGLAELLSWNRAEAKKEALAETTAMFEERFGPIEAERQDAEWRREQVPKAQAQIKAARETWGPLFDADYAKAEKGEKSEIIEYMKANKLPMSRFAEAVQAVLLPKLRADRTKMRGELLAEINARPEASVETNVQVKAPAANRTMEQIIRDASTAAGLKL